MTLEQFVQLLAAHGLDSNPVIKAALSQAIESHRNSPRDDGAS
jgi:hypothetical protein